MATIFLIIGETGTGKTWVMKELMRLLEISNIYSYKTGLYVYLKKDGVIIFGKYDGGTFDGSDHLSMAVMSTNDKIAPVLREARFAFAEGDRFTNSVFIEAFKPVICRIKGDGAEGRLKRGSAQTERQIKSIATRVNNIQPHQSFENSQECLDFLLSQVKI